MNRETIAAIFATQQGQVAARRLHFTPAARRAALARLQAALHTHEAEILAALAADLGKGAIEAQLTELLPLHQEITHARRHLHRWARVRRVRPGLAMLGTSAAIRPEPRGISLIIAPWNYPVNLTLAPLVSALAAGNAAIIKPSEQAPASAAVVARVVAAALPADLATVVPGDVVVAQALLDLPFDHIFFTGSPAVGRQVMAAAARHLAAVTLELGGKSPAIIGPDADLERAADWVVFGKFVNAGQTCIAPDHLFVHDRIRARFTTLLQARLARAYGVGPAAGDDDDADGPGPGPDPSGMARIVNPRHAARLRALLAEAVAGGARILSGAPGTGVRIPPVLLTGLTPQMRLDSDEIFGPILPILPYDDLAAVIARLNARPKPLALYIFDRDRTRVDQVIAATASGGVGVNLTLLHFGHQGLPFGGVGQSGIGAAHGEWGFRAFSHERAILRNRFSPLPLLFPPHGTRQARWLRWLRRWLG